MSVRIRGGSRLDGAAIRGSAAHRLQRIVLRVYGRVRIGWLKGPGWRAWLPATAFVCERHGVVVDYEHGYGVSWSVPFVGREPFTQLRFWGSWRVGLMTVKGTRRIGGVTVSKPDNLLHQLGLASDCSNNPETARGQFYSMLVAAIKEAKKPDRDGYGSCSTGDVLAVANLDGGRRRLISAEFYVVKGAYRDEEAFR